MRPSGICHLSASVGSVLGFRPSAAKQRISRAYRVKRSLGLTLKASGGQAAQQLPVRVGKPRVARPAPPAALLHQVLADPHPTILLPSPTRTLAPQARSTLKVACRTVGSKRIESSAPSKFACCFAEVSCSVSATKPPRRWQRSPIT